MEFPTGRRVAARGSLEDYHDISATYWSTQWNQIEAGVCAALDLPMLIFRESKLHSSGVFEVGATSLFIQEMPTSDQWAVKRNAIREMMFSWRSDIQGHYYGARK